MGKGQEEAAWEGRAKMHGRANKRRRGEQRENKWLTEAVILWTERSDDGDDDDGGGEKRNVKKRSVLFLSTRGQEARNESSGGRGERKNQL